jgi:addiction module RelB/DinJ family antitoxin
MKKSAVVRARIDAELKAQASKVLASCGLELSDAIRLYLQQVVLQEGIPFSIGAKGRVDHVPAEQLWQMKHAAQARDHASAVSSDLSKGERLLIRPDQLREAKVRWSSAKMSD